MEKQQHKISVKYYLVMIKVNEYPPQTVWTRGVVSFSALRRSWLQGHSIFNFSIFSSLLQLRISVFLRFSSRLTNHFFLSFSYPLSSLMRVFRFSEHSPFISPSRISEVFFQVNQTHFPLFHCDTWSLILNDFLPVFGVLY